MKRFDLLALCLALLAALVAGCGATSTYQASNSMIKAVGSAEFPYVEANDGDATHVLKVVASHAPSKRSIDVEMRLKHLSEPEWKKAEDSAKPGLPGVHLTVTFNETKNGTVTYDVQSKALLPFERDHVLKDGDFFFHCTWKAVKK